MNRAAFVLLWSFVFVLPWDEFMQLPLLGSIPHLVGVVASGVGVLYILARRRFRPLSGFHVLAMLFVLWAGLSAFWSIDPNATRARFVTYLQLAVLVWLIWEIGWSPDRLRALLQAYVLGACVAAAAIGYNYVSGISYWVDRSRFAGLNNDPNELGLTLALGLPIAWYLSLSQPGRRLAWGWQLYVPVGAAAILLTASRGAFVAALVALAIIPWALGHLRLRTKAVVYAFAVAWLVLASWIVPSAPLERLAGTRADIAGGYFGGRGTIWRAGLQLVRQRPIAGVGAGGFGEAIAPINGGYIQASHDAYLSILVELGIVGLALFLAMMTAALTPLRRLPTLQRRFSIVLLATLAVGSLSLTWESRKQLWFVLGVLAAQRIPQPARRANARVVVAHASSTTSPPANHSAATGGGV